MKQFVFFILFLVQAGYSASLSVNVNPESQTEQAYTRADRLIQSEEFLAPEGNANLTRESVILSAPMRKLLLEKYAKFEFPVLELVGNFFIPSLGSWLQGDWRGALITDGGVIPGVGLSLLFYWLSMQNGRFMGDILIPDYNYSSLSFTFGIIAIGFYVVNLVFPFTYAVNWNSRLKNGLDYPPAAYMGFDPFSYRTVFQDRPAAIDLLTFRF